MGDMSHIEEAKRNPVKDVHRLSRSGVCLEASQDGSFIGSHNSMSSLVVQVKSKKHFDHTLMEFKE